jgi:hypothetical protein
MTPQKRVLFLCARNAARSQMAEAILRHLPTTGSKPAARGSIPAACTLALDVLTEAEIDTGGLRAKSVRDSRRSRGVRDDRDSRRPQRELPAHLPVRDADVPLAGVRPTASDDANDARAFPAVRRRDETRGAPG